MTPLLAADNVISLEIPAGRAFLPVARLVLGGIGARADMPVEHLEELGLVFDELAAFPAQGENLTIEVSVEDEALAVSMKTFDVDPLSDPNTQRVLTVLTRSIETTPGLAGGHSVSFRFDAQRPG